MIKNKLIFLILFTFLFFGVVGAEDLRVVLTTPQVTFHHVLGDNISYWVGVENRNAFPLEVKINKPSDLIITFYNDTSFFLMPNESRDVYYSILINTTGSYTSYIGVSFSGENTSSFSLSSQLFFNIPQEDIPSSATSGSHSSSSKKVNSTINNINIYVQDGINLSTTTGECDGKKCVPIILNNETILVNQKNIKANEIFKKKVFPILISLALLVLICFLILSAIKQKKEKKNNLLKKDEQGKQGKEKINT